MNKRFLFLSLLLAVGISNAQTTGGGAAGGTAGAGATATAGTSGGTATTTGGTLPGSPATSAGTIVNPNLPGSPVRRAPFAPLNSALPGTATAQGTTVPGGAAGQVPTAMEPGPLTTSMFGLTNAFGPDFVFNNAQGTTLSIAQLQGVLANLHAQIQQALPVVASFNDSFEFSALNAQNTAAPANGATGPSGAAVSTGVSGLTAAGRSAPGLPQTTAGGSVANPGRFVRAPSPATGSGAVGGLTHGNLNPGTLTPTGVTNAFGLAPGFGGPGNANLLQTSASRDALRSMFVLQTDMERMLAVLGALNGGTGLSSLPLNNGSTAGNVLTNGFNSGVTAPLERPRALAPTGRTTGR